MLKGSAHLEVGETEAKRPRLSKDVDAGTTKQRPNYEITLPPLSYDPADWLSKSSFPSPANRGQDEVSDSRKTGPDRPEARGQMATFDFIKQLLRSPLSDWLKDSSSPEQHQFSPELSYFKEVHRDIKPWLVDYNEKMGEDEEEAHSC